MDFWLWDIVLGSFLCNFSFSWLVTLWSWITSLMVSISSSHWPWVWLVVWDLLRASAISRSLPSIYLKWRSHPVIRHSILWSRMRFSAPGRFSIAVFSIVVIIQCYVPSIGRGMEPCETKDHTEHLFLYRRCDPSQFLYRLLKLTGEVGHVAWRRPLGRWKRHQFGFLLADMDWNISEVVRLRWVLLFLKKFSFHSLSR